MNVLTWTMLAAVGALVLWAVVHFGRKADVEYERCTTVARWWKEGYDYVIELASGERYKGHCTVWSDYETAERVPGLESWLCSKWKLIEWGRLNDLRAEKPK